MPRADKAAQVDQKTAPPCTTQLFCTPLPKAWQNTSRTALKTTTPAVLSKVISAHSTEGLIDTMRFRFPMRIAPGDRHRLEQNPEWELKRRKKYKDEKGKKKWYKMLSWYLFVHKATGATVRMSEKSTRITFSPIRVLERSHNLYTERPTVEQVRSVIKDMTTGLFPSTSKLRKQPWNLLHIALTRNLYLGSLRDFIFQFVGMAWWKHSHSKDRIEDRIEDLLGRLQLTWANTKRGNKKRLTLYGKLLEMVAHYFKHDPAEANVAAGIMRVESSYYGSNYLEKLAPYLPPGDDIHIRIGGELVGFNLDYQGLHAAMLSDLLGLLPTKARTKTEERSMVRRNKILAVGMLIMLAYPKARLSLLFRRN